MASTPSGGITLASTLSVAVPVGGNVLSAYTLPVQPSGGGMAAGFTAGTAANQINKVASPSGSAAASPASIDLSSVACVDGQTGFAHVREFIIINDDTAHTLTLDLTVSNAFTGFMVGTLTDVKITIQPGAFFVVPKPLGTNGYVIDSSHKIVNLDPGANTVAYRTIFCGD